MIAFRILSADAMQDISIWKGKDDMYIGEPTLAPATPLVRAAVIDLSLDSRST